MMFVHGVGAGLSGLKIKSSLLGPSAQYLIVLRRMLALLYMEAEIVQISIKTLLRFQFASYMVLLCDSLIFIMLTALRSMLQDPL